MQCWINPHYSNAWSKANYTKTNSKMIYVHRNLSAQLLYPVKGILLQAFALVYLAERSTSALIQHLWLRLQGELLGFLVLLVTLDVHGFGLPQVRHRIVLSNIPPIHFLHNPLIMETHKQFITWLHIYTRMVRFICEESNSRGTLQL